MLKNETVIENEKRIKCKFKKFPFQHCIQQIPTLLQCRLIKILEVSTFTTLSLWKCMTNF